MATPNYLGNGQPPADGGGWLGSLIGGTPAYKGAGQPSSKSSVFGSTPAYKPAPTGAQSAMTSSDANACGPSGPIAIVIPRDVIEQQ